MVEVERLGNNWGKRKVEQARRKVEEGILLRLLFVVEAFNSRLFDFNSRSHDLRFDNFGNKWKIHELNLVTLSISQNVDQNSNKLGSNLSFIR